MTEMEGDGSLDDEVRRIEAMINSPQMRDLKLRNREHLGYVRPRNAATMILVDGPPDNPKVLMGKRNKALKFMPGALVFPGGSVDRADGGIPTAEPLNLTIETRLVSAMRDRPTPRGAKALTLAAIRELGEESGLLYGKPGEFSHSHPDWKIFKDKAVVPSLAGLRLFSRAITPPGMPRRFDTWFFIARAEGLGYIPKNGFDPSGELEELQWISPTRAIAENTREITRVMLVELIQRLKADPDLSADYPAPYYHSVNGRFNRKII